MFPPPNQTPFRESPDRQPAMDRREMLVCLDSPDFVDPKDLLDFPEFPDRKENVVCPESDSLASPERRVWPESPANKVVLETPEPLDRTVFLASLVLRERPDTLDRTDTPERMACPDCLV